MVKINGRKIRELREAQNLTQLYMATTVEVTTDTISRWENRRYPSIKKANALKLAEALQVELAEILDEEEKTSQPPVNNMAEKVPAASAAPEITPPTAALGSRKKPLALIAAIGIGIIIAALWWWQSSYMNPRISAQRILPAHSVPGRPFPVLLRIRNTGRAPLSFILREYIPTGAQVILTHSAAAVTVDKKTGSLKCLGRIKHGELTLGYVLKTSHSRIAVLKLHGTITSRRFGGRPQAITGNSEVKMLPFHWADKNMDNRIDDQEILAVYDDYSEVKGLKIDMDLIEDIWFGSGYSWNAKTGKFIIKP
ncbi:Transcriptional regulator [hydrothermal vent metagenome]|uniref:Transcriptional regulator n=1 Tax=hydrothermal vent metagenome TaxID=652676 RepID=A0A3B0VBW1_9ZZZZ